MIRALRTKLRVQNYENHLTNKLSTKRIMLGSSKGICFSFLFSVNPLIIFLFDSASHRSDAVLLAFFITFWESITSFCAISFVCGGKRGQYYLLQNNQSKYKSYLYCCLVLPIIILIFIGAGYLILRIIHAFKQKIAYLITMSAFLAGPIGAALLMVSNIFFNNDGTLSNIIMNMAPIPTAIVAKWCFKENINKYGWLAISLTMLLLVGIIINYVIAKTYYNDPIALISIALSSLVALFYAFDALTSSHYMHRNKFKLDYETYFAIKVFGSGVIMFCLTLPIVSVLVNQPFYKGGTLFTIFTPAQVPHDPWHFGGLSVLVFVYGIFEAVARVLYYNTAKTLSGTYAIIFMLFMLFGTPVLQIAGHYLLTNYQISNVQGYYGIYTGGIMVTLTMLVLQNKLATLVKMVKAN